MLDPNLIIRTHIIEIAAAELGVREATGHNDGGSVQKYLLSVSLKPGEPWCAAFISYVYARAKLSAPCTGWSPAMFPARRLVKKPMPADLAGIYIPDKRRIAHVGLVTESRDNWIYTIEGNTNVGGGREGDGVYRKVRHIRTIRSFADWITERGYVHE